MGKSKKQKSQLVKVKGTGDRKPVSQKAFKVSHHKATKAKHKAKVVSTNLKRLNFQNKQQVGKNNERFLDVQHSLTTSSQPKQTASATCTVKRMTMPEQPNMEDATKQMAML